jgi:hypothetical protein
MARAIGTMRRCFMDGFLSGRGGVRPQNGLPVRGGFGEDKL